MVDSISPAPTALSSYRSSLLPIYERVCGDEMSFDFIGDNFEEFLITGMIDNVLERNPQRASTYTRLLQREASPQIASDLFIEFLEQGQGCHETSPAGLATSRAMAIKQAADPKAVHVTNGHTYKSHETKLYAEWRKFLTSYIQQTHELLTAPDNIENQDIDGVDFRKTIWQITNSAEVFARVVGITLKTLLSDPPKTLIWSMLRIQWAMINNFRTAVNILRDSARPDSWAAEQFYELLLEYKNTMDSLFDPFNWLQKVVKRYPEEGTSHVRMSVEKSMRQFKSDDAITLWELIDWLFIIADHFGTDEDPININFGIDEEARMFVISLPNLETPSIAYLDLLVHRLGGSRVIRHASNDLKKPVIDIRIPLTETGSDPSAPQGPSNLQGPPTPTITGMTPSGELGSSPYPNISPSMTALQVYYGAQNMAMPVMPQIPLWYGMPAPLLIPLRN